jgi:hypothetical protein
MGAIAGLTLYKEPDGLAELRHLRLLTRPA